MSERLSAQSGPVTAGFQWASLTPPPQKNTPSRRGRPVPSACAVPFALNIASSGGKPTVKVAPPNRPLRRVRRLSVSLAMVNSYWFSPARRKPSDSITPRNSAFHLSVAPSSSVAIRFTRTSSPSVSTCPVA